MVHALNSVVLCFGGDGINVNIDCYFGLNQINFHTPLHVRIIRSPPCTDGSEYILAKTFTIIFFYSIVHNWRWISLHPSNYLRPLALGRSENEIQTENYIPLFMHLPQVHFEYTFSTRNIRKQSMQSFCEEYDIRSASPHPSAAAIIAVWCLVLIHTVAFIISIRWQNRQRNDWQFQLWL